MMLKSRRTPSRLPHSSNMETGNSKAEYRKIVKDTTDPYSTNIKMKRMLLVLANAIIMVIIVVKMNTTKNTLQKLGSPTEKCTKDVLNRSRPLDVTEKKYQKVRQAEEVVAYIIEQLDLIGAPAAIFFGTLLHEYRNGTGPCILYDFYDKDFDIVLFERHYHAVVAMKDEIKRIFGWHVPLQNDSRLIMVFAPPYQKGIGGGFQIDIYGFKINTPQKNLAYFPWDNVTFSMDGLLPFVKYKTIAYDYKNDERRQDLYMYKPFNVPCLLSNLFGANFMTPDKSANYFWRPDAYNQPRCDDMNVTVAEQEELERQLVIGD